MQKLITLLVLIACATAVLGDGWQYYFTYSDNNCTTPVAVELTQVLGCVVKRSTQQAVECAPLDTNSNYSYDAGCVSGNMPNRTEFSALPIVVTTYPSSNNCTVKDYVQYYYLASNYSGPIVVSSGGLRTEATINSTCSGPGVLSATVCTVSSGCPIDLVLPESQCVTGDVPAAQTGCSAYSAPTGAPSDVPTTPDTPSASGAPESKPSTNTTPSTVKTPSAKSSASAISGVISVVALSTLLF